MTATPEPEATPPPPAKRRNGTARRRRLAYLLAAAILLIAGIVAGVIATRPTPKRHHAVAVVKPKPKAVALSAAEFMSRWNRLVAGPSDVATGRVVAYENAAGKIVAKKYEAVSVIITSPTHWHWVVPPLFAVQQPVNTFARGTTTGTVTPAGTVITITLLPGMVRFPGEGTERETPTPTQLRYLPGGYVITQNALPVVSVRRLAVAVPLRSLTDPRVLRATPTAWRVRFAQVAPSGVQPGPRVPPAPASPTEATEAGPVATQHVPFASAPTFTVTPTAAGGLQINTQVSPLTANPIPGGAP